MDNNVFINHLFHCLSFVFTLVVFSVAFGGLLSLSPVRKKLSAQAYTEVQQLFIKAVDPVMKASYPIALISSLVVVYLVRHEGRAFGLSLAGFLLLLVAFIVTMAVDLPLNKRFLSWDKANPPADWQAVRTRWENMNVLRAVLLLASVVCLYLSILL